MEITNDIVEKAYKKLKSSVYYDKTQLILRNRIVEYEQQYPKDMLDKRLKRICNILKDESRFKTFTKKICGEITAISLPKKIKPNESDIIINSMSKEIKIKELQHYIDMPVEGHILGVLWIMLMGYKIDNAFYEHSYGNRIRKKLINEFTDQPTYSPYLFEPYFEQYESWRDKAMSEAQKHMAEKHDVVVITMDFRRYYYSLDVDDKVLNLVYNEALDCDDLKIEDQGYRTICKRLNDFIIEVIAQYSKCFDSCFDGKRILPIGFLPSNILGNWCLNKFDKAIVDGWNPVYYGRYVDDILIVDKVETNSDLYKEVKDNTLTKEKVIECFLTSCSKWKGICDYERKNDKSYGLIQYDENLTKIEKEKQDNDNKKDIKVYCVNPMYNPCEEDSSKIVVQNDKLKMFYFKWDESDALITCFKHNISKNKSEFRHLPEDEAVFQNDDYSDIYSLDNSDTVNKFRGINSIEIDKYELSKFLGKYLRIGGMIRDKVESRFEKDILKIFNEKAIIENHFAWEKVIEILIINERFKALESFCKKINESVEAISFVEDLNGQDIEKVKLSLYKQLHSGLCRNLGLVWKEKRKDVQDAIYTDYLAEKVGESADELIMGYCVTRMMDKSVMPIILDMLEPDEFKLSSNINLTIFDDAIINTKKEWDSQYKYYPYLIGMYDYNLISCVELMNKEKDKDENKEGGFVDLEEIYEDAKNRYIFTNYQLREDDCEHEVNDAIDVKKITDKNRKKLNRFYFVSVGNGKKKKLRIAIANVKLDETNIDKVIKDRPNRSYLRYRDLSQVVNHAIDQKVDMLIMPEAYVPFEWLATLARTCAKNNLAIITGVEHIKHKDKVYNFTAVILPYLEDVYRCSHISFHLKKHYAPSEIEKIEGYRLQPVKGNNYELYKWNDCYFPVYCCYELTSIVDRSIFQSYADMIVAVEWNRDVKYYSNILESLSRDIHCYCIQVNSSEYGDSRITKPSKSEEKDIIRTKGGINSSILVEEINLSELRDFQIKEHSLQQKNKKYKATPPDFDSDIAMKKYKGEDLFD